jgi:hypothetical protein
MNKIRLYIRKNSGDGSQCTDFPKNIFTAPAERDWNEMETFLGNQVFFSRWRASNPDFCTPISCRTGERQSMGQKKPVDIHDKEYAWKWIIAQSNVPIRLSGVRHPHRVRVGGTDVLFQNPASPHMGSVPPGRLEK